MAEGLGLLWVMGVCFLSGVVATIIGALLLIDKIILRLSHKMDTQQETLRKENADYVAGLQAGTIQYEKPTATPGANAQQPVPIPSNLVTAKNDKDNIEIPCVSPRPANPQASADTGRSSPASRRSSRWWRERKSHRSLRASQREAMLMDPFGDGGYPSDGSSEEETEDLRQQPPLLPTESACIESLLYIQLEGKRDTRARYYASLSGTKLHFTSPIPQNPPAPPEVIDLEGATMLIVENMDIKYAIELLNINRPLYRKIDYIYLLFENAEQLEGWSIALKGVCKGQTQQSSRASHLSMSLPQGEKSAKDRMKEMWTRNVLETTETGVKGWLQYQKEENKRTRIKQYCIISGPNLSFYPSDKLGALATAEASLHDCIVEIVPYDALKRLKYALRLSKSTSRSSTRSDDNMVISSQRHHNRNKAFDIVFNCEYIYLFADTESQKGVWFNALQNAIVAAQEQVKAAKPRSREPTTEDLSSFLLKPEESEKALEKIAKAISDRSDSETESMSDTGSDTETERDFETADWFNAILARAFLNMRTSEKFVEKLKSKVFEKLLNKIQEKNANQYIGNIAVLALDLGNTPPVFTAFKMVPQATNAEMALDVWVRYKGKMMIKLGSTIYVGWGSNKTALPFTATATLESLAGKMFIHFPAWPAERCSVAFYKEPDMDISLQLVVGENRSLTSIPKLNETLLKKIRLAFITKFVMPNRKYIRVFPFTNSATTAEEATKPAEVAPSPIEKSPAAAVATTTAQTHDGEMEMHTKAAIGPVEAQKLKPLPPQPQHQPQPLLQVVPQQQPQPQPLPQIHPLPVPQPLPKMQEMRHVEPTATQPQPVPQHIEPITPLAAVGSPLRELISIAADGEVVSHPRRESLT